jgi:ribosome-binding factor A
MPAAALFADDLQNAEEFFRKPSRRNKPDRKLQQLCRQVQRAITFALGGACADPLLQDLVVESVVPSPDASRLTVFVCLPASSEMTLEEVVAEGPPMVELLRRLEAARPILRREVAAAITRKRAPELAFQIVGEREVLP